MVKKQIHPTNIGVDSLCILDRSNDLPPSKIANIRNYDLRFPHELPPRYRGGQQLEADGITIRATPQT